MTSVPLRVISKKETRLMLKVVENNIFGRSSRKDKTNTDKLLTYIQKNIENLVGR